MHQDFTRRLGQVFVPSHSYHHMVIKISVAGLTYDGIETLVVCRVFFSESILVRPTDSIKR